MASLFAQSMSSSPSVFVVLLFLVLILAFVIMVVWLVIRAVKHDRDLTHQERLRAIEHGMQPASLENEKKYQHNAFWASFWIGAGVPIAAIGFTVNTMSSSEVTTTLKIFLWSGVVIIAVACVIVAAVLMRSARPQQEVLARSMPTPPALPDGD